MEIILGRNFSGKAVSVKEIHQADKAGDLLSDVVIEGVVLGVPDDKGEPGIEKKITRTGKHKYRFAIWDGTETVHVQTMTPDEYDIEMGLTVRAKGSSEKNKWTGHKLVFSAQSIISLGKMEKEKRVDEAETKRVELSTRTIMSQLQSQMSEKALLKTASGLGHAAMALTDHNSVQAWPHAYSIAKDMGIKLIGGATLEMFDMDRFTIAFNAFDAKLKDIVYVVFDVETTGFSAINDHIIEIGAAKFLNGKPIEKFQRFVKSPKPIPQVVIDLTKITNEMLDELGADFQDAFEAFIAFIGDAVLVAHNATFDRGFLKEGFRKLKRKMPNYTIIDTMTWSQSVNSGFKNHRLETLSSNYEVSLKNAHRADEDSEATGHILMKMIEQAEQLGVTNLNQLNSLIPEDAFKYLFPAQVTVLVRNETGKKNLFKLMSLAHIKYLSSHGGNNLPKISKQEIEKHREGLLIGSGSYKGGLFDTAIKKTPDEVLEMGEFFDFFEIMPLEACEHLPNDPRGNYGAMKEVEAGWKLIYALAKKLGKPAVATGFVHYPEKEDRFYHHNLVYSESAKIKDPAKKRGAVGREEGYAHFRTTGEMLDAFPWLSPEETYEIVVANSNKIADMCDMVNPVPDKLYTPEIEGAEEELVQMVWDKAKEVYGDPLPEIVRARVDKEITAITKYGYAVNYWICAKMVKNSIDNGYLVGSRGSVGSSIVATFSGITEVNPLKPHYVCPSCKNSEWFGDKEEDPRSGYDLPEKDCPKCGAGYIREGQDIPFETFLGFKGDKVPDIDLNFSGMYQKHAHKYVEEVFGSDFVYRAGTVATVASKTATGFALKYSEENGLESSWAEAQRVAGELMGAKRTTGQHPGGMLVVPRSMEMEDFSPVQFPGNNPSKGYRTSHLDFHAIHDFILKLDILGHEMPTTFRMLKDLTGIDPRTVPAADPLAMKLFYDPEEPLGATLSAIGAKTGTLALPEMGTQFVQDMLVETKPKTFGELLAISGLSHGTDVWIGNAQQLIKDGTCTISEVIGCRDDIMVTLEIKGVESSNAFKIMEGVRKGKGLTPEMEAEMRANNVPEWYIWSCKRIKYMFPKAHAVAYVLDATRMAWYKTYKPLEFYCAVFSAKYRKEDSTEIEKPADMVRRRLRELDDEIGLHMQNKDKNKANKLKKLKSALEIALEAKARGIKFGGVRLYGSHAFRYTIIDGELVPPFSTLPGLGPEIAVKLFEEVRKAPFAGYDDLMERTGMKKNNLETLTRLGVLEPVLEKHCYFF